MAETPFELTPEAVRDLVDALSIASEDLHYRSTELLEDYDEEDRETMTEKEDRFDALYLQLVRVLDAHDAAREEEGN